MCICMCVYVCVYRYVYLYFLQVAVYVLVFDVFKLTGMQFIANNYTALCLVTSSHYDSSLLMLCTRILHVTLKWLRANPHT